MTKKELQECKEFSIKLNNIILSEEKRIILKKESNEKKKVEKINLSKKNKLIIIDSLHLEILDKKECFVNKIDVKILNSKSKYILLKLNQDKMLLRTIITTNDVNGNVVEVYKKVSLSYDKFESFL